MKIVSIKMIQGPSVYHSLPVLVLKMNLEEWSDVTSSEIPGFNRALKNALPGLSKHTCSLGYEVEFYERLSRGTTIPHIIQHIALELAKLSGIEVSFGRSRYTGAWGCYEVITRFKHEEGMKLCLLAAFELMVDLLSGLPADVEEKLAEIRESIRETTLERAPINETTQFSTHKRKNDHASY